MFDGADVKGILAPKRELVDDPSKGSAGRSNVVERGFRERGWIESKELEFYRTKGKNDKRYDLGENFGGQSEDGGWHRIHAKWKVEETRRGRSATNFDFSKDSRIRRNTIQVMPMLFNYFYLTVDRLQR
jgi:hypothetical protein